MKESTGGLRREIRCGEVSSKIEDEELFYSTKRRLISYCLRNIFEMKPVDGGLLASLALSVLSPLSLALHMTLSYAFRVITEAVILNRLTLSCLNTLSIFRASAPTSMSRAKAHRDSSVLPAQPQSP